MDLNELKEEYEKLSLEYSKLNSKLNGAMNGETDQDELDKIELKAIRLKRELDAKYQEIIQTQIQGEK